MSSPIYIQTLGFAAPPTQTIKFLQHLSSPEPVAADLDAPLLPEHEPPPPPRARRRRPRRPLLLEHEPPPPPRARRCRPRRRLLLEPGLALIAICFVSITAFQFYYPFAFDMFILKCTGNVLEILLSLCICICI